MNEATPKVTYRDVEITYNENNNQWEFILRGMNRKAESLTKAKEKIDAPVREKKESTFERTTCWMSQWREGWKKVEATSAVPPRYAGHEGECWINYTNPQNYNRVERQKVSSRDLYPVGEKNDALVEQWNQLDKQIKALEAERDKVKAKMARIKLPSFDPEKQ